MNQFPHGSVFIAWASACVVLCGNLLLLWVLSGAMRSKARTTPNAEDVPLFGGTLADSESPDIARVLRAHANAQASIHPFLALGLVYVLVEGPIAVGIAYFSIFSAARLLHSWAYVTARQPWRSVAFVAGLLTTLVLMMHVVWLLVFAV